MPTKKVIINPLTRISGFMEIDVTIEDNRVTDALTRGMMFRGFEQMMVGRNPFDAIFLTQRICGICSTAHSVGSSVALENALNIEPSEQGMFLRDLIHCCEFLQNHVRHFYQYSVPDFVRLPAEYPLLSTDHQDFRLPAETNTELANHYFESLPISRLAHEMLAVLGGKAPHNHGVFVGGAATPATTDKLLKMKSILQRISGFIETRMLPDVYTIARYYPELYEMGKGPGNFLSYGAFRYPKLGTLYVEPLAVKQGVITPFDPERITEGIDYSWYTGTSVYKPFETISQPDRSKEKAYTWVKAPRYDNLPFEVGPLARLWLNGEYRRGISTMDRIIARALETKKITQIAEILLAQIRPGEAVQRAWQLPDTAEGAGYVETTRGSLAHWVKIKNQVISFYQIITPSAWDFSARDDRSRGTAEQALAGTLIKDPEHPVELGRIVRSFDPCMSCATHVYRPGHEPKVLQVVR